jgi:hypothetical protein
MDREVGAAAGSTMYVIHCQDCHVLCEEQKKQVMSHAASAINITDSDSLLPGRNSLSEGKGGHCSCIGWRTLNQMKVFAAEHRLPWWPWQMMKPEPCLSVSTNN